MLMSGNLHGVLTALDLSGAPLRQGRPLFLSRHPVHNMRRAVELPCSDKSALLAQPLILELLPAGAALRRIRLNYLWAFGYNTVMLPIAAGVLYAPVRLQLPPWVAGAAVDHSSVPLSPVQHCHGHSYSILARRAASLEAKQSNGDVLRAAYN